MYSVLTSCAVIAAVALMAVLACGCSNHFARAIPNDLYPPPSDPVPGVWMATRATDSSWALAVVAEELDSGQIRIGIYEPGQTTAPAAEFLFGEYDAFDRHLPARQSGECDDGTNVFDCCWADMSEAAFAEDLGVSCPDSGVVWQLQRGQEVLDETMVGTWRNGDYTLVIEGENENLHVSLSGAPAEIAADLVPLDGYQDSWGRRVSCGWGVEPVDEDMSVRNGPVLVFVTELRETNDRELFAWFPGLPLATGRYQPSAAEGQ